MSKPTFQTAEGRLRALREAAKEFSEHLEQVPGAVLRPEVRLAVARSTRDALFCKGCSDAQKVCIPKSKSSFDACAELKHDHQIPHELSQVSSCLTRLVHSIVNHQASLDKEWYEKTVQEIKACGLIDEDGHCRGNQDAIDMACYACMAEIITLVATSHGIYATFLALNQDIPPLPDKAAAVGPSNIYFPSLLKQIRRDESICVAPYFLWKDVNTASPEWNKLRDSTKAILPKLLVMQGPLVGLFMALEDFVMYERFIETAYMPPGLLVLMTWRHRNPFKYCPSVSRGDVEAVASSIARQHQCTF